MTALRRVLTRSGLAALVLAVSSVASVTPASATPATSEAPAQSLRVMQWNMWFGGTNVNHYRHKQLTQIKRLAPDVITMEETYGVRARQLGHKLGWDHFQISYSLGIISRFPIVDRLPRVHQGGDVVAAGARIKLDSGQEVDVWTTHLAYNPYGPYDACYSHLTPTQLLQRERDAGRPQEMKAVLAGIAAARGAADAQTPVILGGDFNSPSHLDWVGATAHKHCGYDHVDWPATQLPADAGFLDSFRMAHPDPAADPGTTWSPIYPRHQGATGRKEPQDRIDFLLYDGAPLGVAGSRTYVAGHPKPYGQHQHNRWTSDHAAVISDFTVR